MRLDLEIIDPDGVDISVPLHDMRVGQSVFIPCLNTPEALRQVRMVTNFWGWKMQGRACIENDIWGLRIWRVT